MQSIALLSALLAVSSAAVSPDDVTNVLNELVTLDSNRASSDQVVLNYQVGLQYSKKASQNQASHTHYDHDNALFPLFTSVDDGLVAKPTFTAVSELADLFVSDASQVDPWSDAKRAKWDELLNAMGDTAVFQHGRKFLQDNGLEAVFAGEFLDDDVIGLSNWLRFSKLEAKGAVDYHGWFARQELQNVQLSLQYGLTISGNEKKAMLSYLLVDSSPEFDLIAYTICAVSGQTACTFNVLFDEVTLNVVTRPNGASVLIDNAYPSIGSTKPTSKPGSGGNIQSLVTEMRAADEKASSSQYKINWGPHISGGGSPTGKKLLSNVDEKLFDKPVYSKLRDIQQNNYLDPDVCVNETNYLTGFKRTAFDALLNEWAGSKVFGLMHEYLVKAGKADADVAKFKSFLFTFWFGTYSRCHENKKILGSSGFEHIFSGEQKDLEEICQVDGQHNWMKFYYQEKADKIQYYGYYSNDDQLTGTFKYTWDLCMKKEGGFLFGTSPVFDFSLFTACALTESGAKKCRFTIDNYDLAVTSYTQECAGGGTCLATAYPVEV